jgi:nucleotide-binding universal stress UspA family protein
VFRNVLIGVDGRKGGRDAVALATQLAAPDAELTLAHVFGVDGMLGRGSGMAVPFERDVAQQLLRDERELAGVEASLATAAYVVPGRGLHELAEERSADLIVVGSSRHALIGRALLGDDARASLNGAPCAIAIAPRGYAHPKRALRTFGVGYDGSPESNQALTAARELAQRYDGTVEALWVVSLQDVRDERPLPAHWPSIADELVSRYSKLVRTLPGVEGNAVYGAPREELARLSQRVDLLLVGSRGYGPVQRVFHGSVSSYLLGHVACPLVVMPRAARPAERLPREAQPGVRAAA